MLPHIVWVSADAGVKLMQVVYDPSKIIMVLLFMAMLMSLMAVYNGMGANCDTSNTANKFTVSYKNDRRKNIYHIQKYIRFILIKQAQASWIYGNNLVISFDELLICC